MNFFNNLFHINRKYHWYSVKFIYETKNTNHVVLDYHNQVGFKDQSSILDFRKVKKAMGPIYGIDSTRSHLCNRNLNVELVCYLGYFSKK